MYSDVVDLRDFYATSLGQVACRMIRRRMRLIWPDLTGMRLLRLGYGVPYLRPFRDEAERGVAVDAAVEGLSHWPPGGREIGRLCDAGRIALQGAPIER